VKGLLHEYSDSNLRLIEVAKSDLKDLPVIVEELRRSAEVFVDDLHLKKMTMPLKPKSRAGREFDSTASECGCLRYSNRRHLIREFFMIAPPQRQ